MNHKPPKPKQRIEDITGPVKDAVSDDGGHLVIPRRSIMGHDIIVGTPGDDDSESDRAAESPGLPSKRTVIIPVEPNESTDTSQAESPCLDPAADIVPKSAALPPKDETQTSTAAQRLRIRPSKIRRRRRKTARPPSRNLGPESLLPIRAKLMRFQTSRLRKPKRLSKKPRRPRNESMNSSPISTTASFSCPSTRSLVNAPSKSVWS